MKKLPIVLIMAIIASVITVQATAQAATDNLSKNREETFASNDNSKPSASKSTAMLTRANSKALHNFKSAFKGEQDAKWFVEPGVMVAKFTKDDIQTSVVYDKKGRWIHTMEIYHENKMPRDIRSLVKRSIYFDYDIILVQQIEEGDMTFYVVHLQNGKKYKEVSVVDGEINELKALDTQE